MTSYCENHNRRLSLLDHRSFEEAAEELYRAAIQSENSCTWNEWAIASLQASWQCAEAEFRRTLADNPDNPDAAISLGVLLSHLGRIWEAIPLLEHAAGLATSQSRTLLLLVLENFRKGDFGPRTREICWQLLQMLDEKCTVGRAVEELFIALRGVEGGLRHALELDPWNRQAVLALCTFMNWSGRTEEAGRENTHYKRISTIAYWTKDDEVQNFGDALTTLIITDVVQEMVGTFHAVHLIGSTICDYIVERDMERWSAMSDPLIAFWGCGMRDARKLDANVYAACRFFGVRGPLTRKSLGLPENTPIGDPALIIPILYQPMRIPELVGKTLCIPHFEDSTSEGELLRITGADVHVSPRIGCRRQSLLHMIDVLASASFVLTGSLHCAVVACALGTPFAFFDIGHVDMPFKWLDFAASIHVPAIFARDISEGRLAYESFLKDRIRRPRLTPLLQCAPFVLRRGLIEKAIEYDRSSDY